MESKPSARAVSPNNPCPFLRAMAAYGYIQERMEGLSSVARKITQLGTEIHGKKQVSKNNLYVIALIANGLSPLRLLRNFLKGVDVGDLRNGPLDKQGVGSRIIDIAGKIDEAELARLNTYAIDVTDKDSGRIERGLCLKQIHLMMDDNFERSKGHRRKIDRALMNGEWPVLLKVLGKNEGDERYLSLDELRELFVNLRLPDRISQRLKL